MHNPKNGEVTTNSTYDLIVSTLTFPETKITMPRISACTIPLKIKSLLWLAIENRISTWDNLIRKGWNDLDRFCLCLGEEESINHIFLVCPFILNIVDWFSKRLGQVIPWTSCSFLQNLENCFLCDLGNSDFPLFIIWCVWNTRNLTIFENKNVISSSTCQHVLSLLNAYPVAGKTKK